jgi:catechol 2,3-dioxygenase-like lactoylglutathione lyase family enzyme
MPQVAGVLETSLYVADLARSTAFYRDGLGFRVLFDSPRLVAFDAGMRTVLLIFPRGMAAQDLHEARGTIPGHDGSGHLHVAFAIAADSVDSWRQRLAELGVKITGEYRWPRGGLSLYFADPDGHVLELATPGLWQTY